MRMPKLPSAANLVLSLSAAYALARNTQAPLVVSHLVAHRNRSHRCLRRLRRPVGKLIGKFRCLTAEKLKEAHIAMCACYRAGNCTPKSVGL